MLNSVIPGKTVAIVVAAEIAILAFGAWLYMGMPGMRSAEEPSAVTIRVILPTRPLGRTYSL